MGILGKQPCLNHSQGLCRTTTVLNKDLNALNSHNVPNEVGTITIPILQVKKQVQKQEVTSLCHPFSKWDSCVLFYFHYSTFKINDLEIFFLSAGYLNWGHFYKSKSNVLFRKHLQSPPLQEYILLSRSFFSILKLYHPNNNHTFPGRYTAFC